MATREQQIAILQCCNALYETVKESGPRGAPSGPMYAACMHRLSLEQYEQIMGVLIKAGLITKRGHVYYAVK